MAAGRDYTLPARRYEYSSRSFRLRNIVKCPLDFAGARSSLLGCHSCGPAAGNDSGPRQLGKSATLDSIPELARNPSDVILAVVFAPARQCQPEVLR